jgi:hypothetical protein
MTSQNKQMLNDLLTGYRVTQLDAIYRYGCSRLSGRIYDLRNEGFDVQDKWKEVKTKFGTKRVKEYFIKN